MEFYPLDSIASQIKGTDPKASEFIGVGLGIRDYKRGSTGKVQRSAERASISSRNVPQLGKTPTGRPNNTKRVLEGLRLAKQDMEGLGTDLANNPIATSHEEINSILTEEGQLKRLSDV